MATATSSVLISNSTLAKMFVNELYLFRFEDGSMCSLPYTTIGGKKKYLEIPHHIVNLFYTPNSGFFHGNYPSASKTDGMNRAALTAQLDSYSEGSVIVLDEYSQMDSHDPSRPQSWFTNKILFTKVRGMWSEEYSSDEVYSPVLGLTMAKALIWHDATPRDPKYVAAYKTLSDKMPLTPIGEYFGPPDRRFCRMDDNLWMKEVKSLILPDTIIRPSRCHIDDVEGIANFHMD